ncbi:hypothetical protein EC988_008682 [Linderina pennispora]|nr:hypothetical protein EC988_008682 [Linderina pennispora]
MSQSIPISGNRKGQQQQQGAPIPINAANVPKMNVFAPGSGGSGSDSTNFRLGSELSTSHLGMTGIEAPPNSLVQPSLMSAHAGSGSSTAQMLGGWNPPPNTPAQASKLQQVINQQQYGAGQVPTGSFIDRKIQGMAQFREADEDEMDVSLEDSNPSSFQHNSHLSKQDLDDTFEMEQ